MEIKSHQQLLSAAARIRRVFEVYVRQYNIQSVVLGVSGGIDSALVAALVAPVCKDIEVPLIGRSIPIESNKANEIARAREIGIHFCTDFKEVDLTSTFLELKELDFIDAGIDRGEQSRKIRMGNIKARLRMMYLYNLAAKSGGMVLSTDNWTEYLLGFWTLHGDVGDFGPIQELWKTEVYDMTDALVALEDMTKEQKDALISCITAMATDGLGVTDLGDLGQIMPNWVGESRMGYRVIDEELNKYTNKEESCDPVILERHLRTEYKRNNPYNVSRNLIFKID